MSDQLNGGGRRPVCYPVTATEIISELAKTGQLFRQNGELVRPKDGKAEPVSAKALVEITYTHLGIWKLVNRGTAAEPWLESELVPLEIPERFAAALLRGEEISDTASMRRMITGQGTALVDRVPAA
jgi:hypothetical protein